MSFKKNIVENIFIILMVLLASSIGIICFNNNLILTGFTIIISFMIMILCIVLLKLQRGKLNDAQNFIMRGSLLKKFKCDCTCCFRNNISESYLDGYIVFYNNGLTYEYQNKEFIDYISYDSILRIELDNMQLSIWLNPSYEIINLSILSNSILRTKMIMNYLSNQGVNGDDVTFE